MNSINVNGVSYSGHGNVSIINGKVMIDGKDVTPDAKEIIVSIEGNVDVLKVDACNKVSITGNAGSVATQSGDVECGDVTGSVQTMSGDVDCKNIGGRVSTMSGDIKQRKW